MTSLSEGQLGSVRTLIQTASDSAIRALEMTLSSGAERHDAMRVIQQVVAGEAADRRSRNLVFAPLAPLSAPASACVHDVRFPPVALSHLWRGLKAEAAGEVQAALATASDYDSEASADAGFDALCLKAAKGLRERANPSYAAAAEALDAARAQGAEIFAAYLDLVPVARAALQRLPEWLGRATDERMAAARLAFRDATAISEDAGPRLLEILYAHLDEPWTVLRLISAVMHRPVDSYVANSELASFGERLLDDVDARLESVTVFDPDAGREEGERVGRAVRAAATEIQEFDDSVDLSREGPWGARLTRQKRALTQSVEVRLKSIEAEVAAALPVQSSGLRHRGARGQPKLSQAPDERLVKRASACLSLLQETRSSAERLGYGALWTKTAEAVQSRLDTYAEDLLDRLRAGAEDDDFDRIREYLEIAADFLGLASGDKAAQIVRRRMAAAADRSGAAA